MSSYGGALPYKTLWVLTVFLLAAVVGQQVTVSETPNNLTTTESPSPSPLPCVNGEFLGSSCVCMSGWTGQLCDTCVRGRLKLTDASGLIFDGSETYVRNSQCLFYIEANSSVSAIHLRFRSFHTECQWDALSVFEGDSIFDPKIAAYTGDLIELPLEEPTVPMDNQNMTSNSTTEPPQMNRIPIQYQDPKEITLSSSGPQMLLYFYTDAGQEAPGFEIAYWFDYSCPDNCSGRGVCDNGSCICDSEWTGEFCHLTVCPNNCSGNGVCDSPSLACLCLQGYTGPDCSINVSSPHWERVETTPLPENLTQLTLARASHSAVLWEDSMLVYGGYQFPLQDYYYRPEPPEMNTTLPNNTMSNTTNSTVSDVDNMSSTSQQVSILRYHFATKSWDEIPTYPGVPAMGGDVPGNNGTNSSVSDDEISVARIPESRYGHTAVIYNNTMYVFGGTILSTEQITNEFWALDLTNFTWALIPVSSRPPSPNISDSGIHGGTGDGTVSLTTVDSESNTEPLPLAVRTHTAHVISNKMVSLFGLSTGRSVFLSYVQEYDFDTGRWSLPAMRGVQVTGRMGHSSVYDPQSGLIYVHGGARPSMTGVHVPLREVIALNPSTYTWTMLTNTGQPRFLHSSVLMGPLLVTFGGCETDRNERDCFKNDTHIYNTLCDTWEEGTFPGLPGNASRYGHSSIVDSSDGSWLVFGGYLGTFHHDLLKLNLGNCSQYGSEGECVNSSGLCAWSRSGVGECVTVGSGVMGEDLVFKCQVDPCSSADNCSSCNLLTDCLWNATLNRCISPFNISLNISSDECMVDDDTCDYFSSCADCVNHGCSWGRYNGSGSVVGCVDRRQPEDSTFIDSPCPDPALTCFSRTSCADCSVGTSCLWCPSLGQCVPSYPLTYIYSQCLGWVGSCPDDCSSYPTCGHCQNDTRCGWCNDPSDTGLGSCIDGGFVGPRENESCMEVDQWGRTSSWNFYQCPACQCNGHSSCVNGSICEQCDNNTTGDTCDRCDLGYFGDPRNGRNCSDCDCNGYNPVCDDRDGTCTCLSFGVGGDHCELCEEEYDGDPDNFCYSPLAVGFIYSFTVNENREVEGFFVVTPPEDKNLHFRIEVNSNPSLQPLVLQLFVGKLSEDLWLLANITDPIELNDGDTHDVNYVSFQSNSNSSFSQLFSFTNPSIQNTQNFTDLLANNSENKYTNRLWDGDVSLVIYLSNLSNPSQFRLTVDQQDYIFLLYFFATFVTCFSVLLLAFLVGWYAKRKLEYRALVRQQYIELQRRVARPFARLRAVIEPVPPPSPDSPPPPQHPSYIGVETCRNGKAAVLSLFVRLPGNHKTGKPCPGRTGLAIGSTLVSVNASSKKIKDKSKKKTQREASNDSSEGRPQRGTNSAGGRNGIRLREVNSLTTST